MPSIINAIVEQVSVKPRMTKFGQKDTFSFKAQGEWFNTGFKKHPLNVGDAVSCDYVDGSYGKDVDVSTIKKGTPSPNTVPAPGPAKAGPVNGSTYGGKGVFPIPPLDGQRSIVRQNCVTNARELVAAQFGGKPFTIGDDTINLVIHVARQFEAYSCGDSDVEEVEREIADEARAVENGG